MICHNCQTANADDANFCLKCGYRISIVCQQCSRRVPSHAKFCDACGHALARSSKEGAEIAEHQLVVEEQPSQLPQTARQTIESDEKFTVPRADESEQQAPAQQQKITEQLLDKTSQPLIIPQSQSAPTATVDETAGDRSPPTDSPLTQYIPRGLMRKLEAARSSGDMVGERRIVTMLFCDVKGSTAAAEQLDPEEWSEIINGAFEHMIKPVYTYEGTIARLMGDRHQYARGHQRRLGRRWRGRI